MKLRCRFPQGLPGLRPTGGCLPTGQQRERIPAGCPHTLAEIAFLSYVYPAKCRQAHKFHVAIKCSLWGPRPAPYVPSNKAVYQGRKCPLGGAALTLHWHFPAPYVPGDALFKEHNTDLSVNFPANCPKRNVADRCNGVCRAIVRTNDAPGGSKAASQPSPRSYWTWPPGWRLRGCRFP